MKGFAKLVPQEARVLRNGHKYGITADCLVVGDIIEVKSGDRLPADIRILASSGFKVGGST